MDETKPHVNILKLNHIVIFGAITAVHLVKITRIVNAVMLWVSDWQHRVDPVGISIWDKLSSFGLEESYNNPRVQTDEKHISIQQHFTNKMKGWSYNF